MEKVYWADQLPYKNHVVISISPTIIGFPHETELETIRKHIHVQWGQVL